MESGRFRGLTKLRGATVADDRFGPTSRPLTQQRATRESRGPPRWFSPSPAG